MNSVRKRKNKHIIGKNLSLDVHYKKGNEADTSNLYLYLYL
jgi:hypothetical protein